MKVYRSAEHLCTGSNPNLRGWENRKIEASAPAAAVDAKKSSTMMSWQALCAFAMSLLCLAPCLSFVIVPDSPQIGYYGSKTSGAFSLVRSATSRLQSTVTDRDVLVQDLLNAARNVGQVGSLASEEDQEMLLSLAKKLVDVSDSKPAQVKLRGVHDLVYSAAPGGSSGRLVGPFYGNVQQTFLNDNDGTFINSVEFGPLKIALRANCQNKNETVNAVAFQETTVSLFGNEVVKKKVAGGGTWKYLFLGEVEDTDGSKKLVRVMETPSLFIIEQPVQ